MKLHPDTARAIADEQERRNRPWRLAVLALAALLVAALLFLARGVI